MDVDDEGDVEVKNEKGCQLLDFEKEWLKRQSAEYLEQRELAMDIRVTSCAGLIRKILYEKKAKAKAKARINRLIASNAHRGFGFPNRRLRVK